MTNLKLLLIALLSMLAAAGCGGISTSYSVPVGGVISENTAFQPQTKVTVPAAKNGEKGKTGDLSGKNTESAKDKNLQKEEEGTDKKAEGTKSEADRGEAPASPKAAVSEGKKLKFSLLDKLDNTKYSWYFTMNKEHKLPAIPAAAKKLAEKYDGIYAGDATKKVVYLTFDEGYENGYTASILDTLKANDVKALFFITGPYLKKNSDLIKRMLDEGHAVGNHSINHPSLPGVDDATLEKELYGLEELYKAKFDKGFKYMRPPMGEYSERVLAAASQLGYRTVFWSFAYRDWEVDKQKGPDYAYKMVMDNLHSGAVLLLHAVSSDNAQALDRIIKGIREAGYEIPPFDL